MVVPLKPGQLDVDWFKDAHLVEQMLESYTRGFLVLESSNAGDIIRGKICHIHSENMTHNDQMEITVGSILF